MSDVTYQPTRGHQCQVLRRWVTRNDPPYAVPEEVARRYVRHGLGHVVTEDAESAPVAPEAETVSDPERMTKAELGAVLGLDPHSATKAELVARFRAEADESAYQDGEERSS